MTKAKIEVDVLIIGTGPAGASLATFLGHYDQFKIMMVSRFGTSADTPRAHITNMAAMECLRSVGLEDSCKTVASPSETLVHTRWCHTLLGEEYARVPSWGHHPDRIGDYQTASPCEHCDLPQTLLEPILLRDATLHKVKLRWDTLFLSFKQFEDHVETVLQDRLSGEEYVVVSKYLVGADGARSQVVEQLGLELDVQPGQGLAINVCVDIDLTQEMEFRKGNLHWVLQPDRRHPEWGWASLIRMVKPWTKWMIIILPEPGAGSDFHPAEEDIIKRIREMIGDDKIPMRIESIAQWQINEIYAKQYSKGRIYCMGDAVHRHPPFGALGSNTCIQDGFNLAWKLAYVMQGKAGEKLLDSYQKERQPVGATIVQRANQGLRDHYPVWRCVGALEKSPEKGKEILAELKADSESGRRRRKQMREAVLGTTREFHALGIEMNQLYLSDAVYLTDQGNCAEYHRDPQYFYQPSTYPGRRLPHAWLNSAVPHRRLSTLDLCPYGSFSLFTGIGGETWKTAAAKVAKQLNISIASVGVGRGLDFEDMYMDWASLSEIDESGCVLVRPDRFVAWRSKSIIEDPVVVLKKVLLQILARFP